MMRPNCNKSTNKSLNKKVRLRILTRTIMCQNLKWRGSGETLLTLKGQVDKNKHIYVYVLNIKKNRQNNNRSTMTF